MPMAQGESAEREDRNAPKKYLSGRIPKFFRIVAPKRTTYPHSNKQSDRLLLLVRSGVNSIFIIPLRRPAGTGITVESIDPIATHQSRYRRTSRPSHFIAAAIAVIADNACIPSNTKQFVMYSMSEKNPSDPPAIPIGRETRDASRTRDTA